MPGAVNVGRQLIGDELRDLRIFVPCLRDAERLAEFRLIGVLQLGIVEYILAIVEGELVAVVEDAPAKPGSRRCSDNNANVGSGNRIG